jgi:hypothetical protein
VTTPALPRPAATAAGGFEGGSEPGTVLEARRADERQARMSAYDASRRAAGELARQRTAIVGVLLLGLNVSVSFGLSTGLLAGLALLPVWLPSMRLYRGATLLSLLALLSVASGWVLVLSSGERDLDLTNGLAVSLQVVTAFSGVGLIVWARRILPLPRIGLLYGIGLLVGVLPDVPGSDNPWKYQFAIPVTVIALALLEQRRRPLWASVLVLAVLGVLAVLNDYRSYLGFSAATVALMLWQARPDRGRRLGAPLQVLLLGALAYVTYRLVTALLLAGTFGYELQQRSINQVRQAGSLLLGGRPEWQATLQLMKNFPTGFGVGAEPNSGDVTLAKQGLARVGVPTRNGYIDHYMFGGQFKLHSVAADLWSNFGLVGLLLGGVVTLTLLLSLTSAMADRRVVALVAFLALTALWDMPFGPIYSSLPALTPALGLLLLPRDRAARVAPPNTPLRLGHDRTAADDAGAASRA